MKRIYLDYAATTPIDPKVSKTMREFELEFFGNPSSTHREGQRSRAKIDFARATVAKFINAKPQEIIFTSGATEANNLAIQGVVNYAIQYLKIKKPHVITTKLEHQSVYNLVKELEKRGVIEATFISVSKGGMIDPTAIKKSIKKNTVLISVIFVSNEIGSILPVREIGKMLRELQTTHYPLPTFHIDAVQAAKFLNCNVEKLACDFMTLSAHKLYGPKGIGALFVKTGSKLANLTFGGSQEYGKRPGTQNTAGIIGMAKAVELMGSLEGRQKTGQKISLLRDKLIAKIKTIPGADLNGLMGEDRIADNVSFTFFEVDQDALLTALDLAGIAASTGSACVSGMNEPSHVIEALGKTTERVAATVRLTLGKNTTVSDIDYTIKILNKLIPKLRHEK